MRSSKVPLEPWNGRRVGDSEPPPKTEQTEPLQPVGAQVRRAHARRRVSPPPPVLDDQFIQNFFTWAVLRSPNATEATYWKDQFRVAYAQGQASVKLAAVEFGKTMFESAEYAARNRNDHWYVYDLYKTFLMRDPDAPGWANWESMVPLNGRVNVRRAFEEAPEFATILASIVPNGSPSPSPVSLVTARTEPRNQPGYGMLARDANWNVPLLRLSGRNGLDLGLGLSYSSMVWTRSGPYLHFDEDNGFPSPGFRLGFPTVQRRVFNAQTAKNTYLLVTASGQRVELRQVGTTNVYEAADSSYLQLTDSSPNLVLRATDGTQLNFTEIDNEYRCTQVKDRNGNYLSVSRNGLGQITNITDTLGRVINFNYDSNANLISITQAWNGQPSHQWVSFGWGTRNMQPGFTSGAMVGTATGQVLPVVTQVALNDTSHFTFDYTNALQVSIIRNYFAATERHATSFTYETPAGDVPRLLDSRASARNWTNVNGVPAQVITTYSVAGDGACFSTASDGTIYKEYYGTDWQKGLTTLSEVWSGGVKQKWTTTAWTQDNTSVAYQLNPRVTETNVYDVSSNRRRTVIDYGTYAQWGLPYTVKEYANDGATELRRTVTDYNLSQTYLDRRIIGLESQVLLLANVSTNQGKITYGYDDPARLQALPAAPTRHDSTYNTSFTSRGNVTSVSRWDFTDINNAAKKLTSYTNYSIAGTPLSVTDASGHQGSISYTDAFSDSVNRNTFAHPTTITDADGFSSLMQYNFDHGAMTRMQSPTPAGQTQGTIQTMTYNTLGQLERITTTNNSAYKRFWYGVDFVASYATVNNVADELYTIEVVDGRGRVIGEAANHLGSTGGYRLVSTIYDQMGRMKKQSNPTEVNSSWVPVGDDAAGMYYTQQTYDWMGRPLVTTNQDGTTKTAAYSGCGCAGGAVVTLTDEGTLDGGVAKRRQQKIYSDVFGRTVKTEILNWQGGSIYSATVNTYNVRDQISQIRQYAGIEGSGSYQETAMTYDGYGRLKTEHVPDQNAGANTVWTYNADDTVATATDARGAIATYGYNSRHLITSITYSAPPGVTSTANVTYGYDAAGNRASMTDGVGSHTYSYNQLSRMTSETTSFTGFAGSYTLSYGYNLAGALTSLAEPAQFGATVGYSYDAIGRLTAVTGSGGISQVLTGLTYRAWGGLKHANYGDGPQLNVTYNARLLPMRYEMSNVFLSDLINPGYFTMGTENDYYADGRLRYARDLQDGNFDRLFTFDHVGRLKESYTGREARGLPPNNPVDSPFRQSYTYNVWNNMSRTGRHWTPSVSDTPSYTNNRRADWTYNADGAVISRDQGQRLHTYDAAGRQRNFYEEGLDVFPQGHYISHQYTINQTYDGSGQVGKRVEMRHSEDENGVLEDSIETRYQLHSSVLGGALIVEIDQWGNRWAGHVYAGGELIADYYNYAPNTSTSIRHRNPTTGQWVKDARRTELDPLGADVGYTDPYAYNLSYSDIMGAESLYYHRGNPFDIRGGCSLDGLPISCSELQERMDRGTVEQEYTFPDFAQGKPSLKPSERGSLTPGFVWRTERVPILSLGIGLFISEHPYLAGGPAGSGNNEGYYIGWKQYAFAFNPQQRSDARPKHDKEIKVPKVTEKGIPLSDCAKLILGAFLKEHLWNKREPTRLLDDILLYAGVPEIIKKNATITVGAFTYGNNIYLDKGWSPTSLDNFEGLSLLVHEYMHSLQADAFSPPIVFGALYLAKSGSAKLSGKDPYYDNAFEVSAREVERDFRIWLEKNYGKDDPCKRLAGGAW
jgi:YD repeat-containing protein